MDFVEIDGNDLDMLLRELTTDTDGIHTVRIAFDGGVKVKVNEGMWSLPLGEVQAEKLACICDAILSCPIHDGDELHTCPVCDAPLTHEGATCPNARLSAHKIGGDA